MLIHEVPEQEGKITLCCGMFPSLLRSKDVFTRHPEIVTCDGRVPRCPGCKGEAGYLGMSTQYASEFMSANETVLTVEPCEHAFTVHITPDFMVSLTERPPRNRIEGPS